MRKDLFSATILLVTLLLATAILPGCKLPTAEPNDANDVAKVPPEQDDDYRAALSTANAFCEAWRRGNYLTARDLMTVPLRRRWSERQLRAAIEPPANVRHAGYQIETGRQLEDGSVVFDVRL